LSVAAGRPLSVSQADVAVTGHAIEYRIYAESPAQGFTPTTGRVLRLGLPEGDGIRLDLGIAEGQRVTSAFDPMLAKLVVHGADRAEAIARADRALADFALLGCETNAEFLRRLNADEAFGRGDVHTGFLDANPQIAAEPELEPATLARLLATASLLTRPVRDAADAVPELHAAMGAWRN